MRYFVCAMIVVIYLIAVVLLAISCYGMGKESQKMKMYGESRFENVIIKTIHHSYEYSTAACNLGVDGIDCKMEEMMVYTTCHIAFDGNGSVVAMSCSP